MIHSASEGRAWKPEHEQKRIQKQTKGRQTFTRNNTRQLGTKTLLSITYYTPYTISIWSLFLFQLQKSSIVLLWCILLQLVGLLSLTKGFLPHIYDFYIFYSKLVPPALPLPEAVTGLRSLPNVIFIASRHCEKKSRADSFLIRSIESCLFEV